MVDWCNSVVEFAVNTESTRGVRAYLSPHAGLSRRGPLAGWAACARGPRRSGGRAAQSRAEPASWAEGVEFGFHIFQRIEMLI